MNGFILTCEKHTALEAQTLHMASEKVSTGVEGEKPGTEAVCLYLAGPASELALPLACKGVIALNLLQALPGALASVCEALASAPSG